MNEIGELRDYTLKINGDVQIGIGELRVDEEAPTYFLVAVFEKNPNATTNYYTNPYLYASGGYDHLPESISLSLFTNKNYVIQALALKRANLNGLAISEGEHNGEILSRLDLGWDGNWPQPAFVPNKIEYDNPWLTTNSGVLLFNDGYMHDLEDKSDRTYRGPLLMDSYYGTTEVSTFGDVEEIVIEPTRNVFGLEVNASLSADERIEIYVGRSYTSPIVVTAENVGEVFIMPPHTYESEMATWNLKVVYLNDNESEEALLYQEENHNFPLLKRTILNINLPEGTLANVGASISLIELPLEEGDVIEIGN
ncbi:MAG: hypothetical protein RIF46_13220 [Cyclobacteriaceae bacterium]